jgi:hypothetical protein
MSSTLRVTGVAGVHPLGPFALQFIETGSALVGEARVYQGLALVATIAAGSAVGTKLQLPMAFHRAAPLNLYLGNAADVLLVNGGRMS